MLNKYGYVVWHNARIGNTAYISIWQLNRKEIISTIRIVYILIFFIPTKLLSYELFLGDSGDYSESEGYTNDEGDGDGESEHYETAEEEDDDY